MPYLVHTPKDNIPYGLADEEANYYLPDFQKWGWRCEYLPRTDDRIREAAATERGIRRKSLNYLFDKERERLREESKRKDKQASKLMKEKAAAGAKPTLTKRISNVFRKEKKKEPEGYRDGVYVNHIEDLQKGWFDGEVKGHLRIRKGV